MLEHLGLFASEILIVLTAPRCAACDGLACGRPALFCASCALHLERALLPVHGRLDDPHDVHVAGFIYGGPIAQAIVRFKHGGLPALGARLASPSLGLARPPHADLAVPVPLHPRRLAARGFNPAGVLARRIAAWARARPALCLLRRTRDTPTQGGLGAAERSANVHGAFAVHPRAAGRLCGRSVLLVDDVWTTGATARECARTLLRAGASRVSVWTLARVP